MVATHHAEMAAGVRKLTLFDVLDPGAEDAERNIVLFLAGDRARVTADTAIMIDYEAVPQFAFPPQPVLLSANSSEQNARCQSGQHRCSKHGEDDTPLLEKKKVDQQFG
jgi:hypothetical protein